MDKTATETIKDEEDAIETPLGTFVRAKHVPSTLGIAKEAIESLVRWYA
jgi:hypothetical protein